MLILFLVFKLIICFHSLKNDKKLSVKHKKLRKPSRLFKTSYNLKSMSKKNSFFRSHNLKGVARNFFTKKQNV